MFKNAHSKLYLVYDTICLKKGFTMQKLFSSKRRISFIVGAVIFFSTLLIFFYAIPQKSGGSLSDRRSKTDISSSASIPSTVKSSTKSDYSALSSKLKSGKSDSTILLYILLLSGASFMIYSVVKKEDKQ